MVTYRGEELKGRIWQSESGRYRLRLWYLNEDIQKSFKTESEALECLKELNEDMKTKRVRICIVCGKSFIPSHGRTSMCSEACREKHKSQYMKKYLPKNSKPQVVSPPITKVCPVCNKTFIRPKKGLQIFCSKKCQRSAARIRNGVMPRGTKYKKTCKFCGAEFTTEERQQMFCNKVCSSKFYYLSRAKKHQPKKAEQETKNQYAVVKSVTPNRKIEKRLSRKTVLSRIVPVQVEGDLISLASFGDLKLPSEVPADATSVTLSIFTPKGLSESSIASIKNEFFSALHTSEADMRKKNVRAYFVFATTPREASAELKIATGKKSAWRPVCFD